MRKTICLLLFIIITYNNALQAQIIIKNKNNITTYGQKSSEVLYIVTYLSFYEGALLEYNLFTNQFIYKIPLRNACKSLMQASDGNLYGITYNDGLLFKFDPITEVYINKTDSNEFTRDNLENCMIESKNGKLYGLCTYGGGKKAGFLYELYPLTGEFSIKYEFKDYFDFDGYYPKGTLVEVFNEKFYGTCSGWQNGLIFEYDLQKNVYSIVIRFDKSNGSLPSSSLTLATNGKYYGITAYGGLYDKGVLYEFNASNGKLTKIIDFDEKVKGSYPYGDLILATSGKLYGIARNGGKMKCGVLFEYDPISGNFMNKIDFDENYKVKTEYLNLFVEANNKIFGLAWNNESPNGLLVCYDLRTGQFSILKNLKEVLQR